MPTTIIYACFGGARYYAQLRFSLLSLFGLLDTEPRPGLRIVVYCDDPRQVPVHPQLSTIALSARELAAYRGPLNYVHRVKPSVLARAEREVGLPFLYIDTDTRWLRLPDAALAALAAPDGATAYMHVCEGTIDRHRESRYYRLLRRHTALLADFGIPAQGPWTNWNAGVIGLPVSAAGFFDQVLRLTDRLILLTSRRNWVEQLATALIADSRFRLTAIDDCIEHYWGYSGEFSPLLSRFLDGLPAQASLAEQARLCSGFQVTPEQIAAIRRDRRYRRQRFYGKLRNSLRKRVLDLRILWLRRFGSLMA
jgi:hypothetical protein